MDEDKHPLFFEAENLTDREKEKIRRYFQIKRESGGGECGRLEKAGGNIYKICFKEKEDQERVLQRNVHTISLSSREVRLTTSRTNPPHNPDQPPTQTFTKANTTGLEKIFKIETHLLQYLKDNTKAYKGLQKQLTAIGCTLELNLDEEKAVVKGGIEKGPGGAAEKWETQVDQVLNGLTERYLCYHVLNPKQVKMVKQDSSFATDDIRVYTEIGYSVVVGEVKAVVDRIATLKNSMLTRKELAIVEKKFKLVEEEFSQEMRVHCPEVKIQMVNKMIVMEGPDKEVQSGASKLNELMKRVREKRVKFPSDLISFIASSDAISKYQARFQQNLRNPVALEVGSDLVLTSLSPGALDEAEAAVKRDLSMDTVKLEGDAAAPPALDRLKEILTQAKKLANRGEFRVDFSFFKGASWTAVTHVKVLGYSDNVNKLKEVLNEYQMNQVKTQEVLNLPHPEMVDCFDKILSLFGFSQTKVELKATAFPTPCVFISGPRCHVQEVKQALNSVLASLTTERLVLDGPGAQQYFQAKGKVSKDLVESFYQVLIIAQQSVYSPDVKAESQSISSLGPSITPRPSTTRTHCHTVEGTTVSKTSLEIKIGSLEDEQVNVLVVPMVNKNLTSTIIGKNLLKKAGETIKSKFDSVAANFSLTPGDVMQVTGPPSLDCMKLFFIECLPWDGGRGQSVQALNNGLKRCLDLCVQQQLSSVAFPVIGPGIVLKYPQREAVAVLTENIYRFGLSASSGYLTTIHIVIKPGYPDSEQCYHDVYNHLSSNMNQGGQVIFRSLTSDLDDITMTVGGGVNVQVVFGDITNETTDAIVNTTNFVNFEDDGVCKDILAVAGPEVKAKLEGANVSRGGVFVTQSGSFPCKAILHVCGEKDAGVIEQLVSRIIRLCESSGYQSVAIPAICAGAGGMDPGVVANAILRGVKTATSSTPLWCLTDIRLVVIKIQVFLAFKVEATQNFLTALTNKLVVHQLPHEQYRQPPRSLSEYLGILQTSPARQQSCFLLLGHYRKDVKDAITMLKDLYQAQCSTQTITKEQLEGLNRDDIKNLKKLVETKGLYIQEDKSAPNLMVSGLKDVIDQVMQGINASLHDNLRREVRVREEEDLYACVAWCILRPKGNWERLPKKANYNLENNDIAAGIVDAQNTMWNVDLQAMKATTHGARQVAELKRLENLPDFTLPLYWDNMAAGENMKRVELQPSSAEYQRVKETFKRTAKKTVLKIERLQNIHLRKAYEARKKYISIKKSTAGEKFLYHGTTQDNCDSIMETGFNRSFAGQNATLYGNGSYFAVDASYSANPTYSKPAADGSQLMFVARVLTGIYTLGKGGMKVPPPRNSQQPHDRYDSVVDKMDNPSMYIVFHDSQAYSDYLITFK